MTTREEFIDELEYYAQTWMDLQLAYSYDGDTMRAADKHAAAEKDVLGIVDAQAARIAELEAQVREWRGNHDYAVGIKRKQVEMIGGLHRRITELETMLRELEWAEHDGTDFCRACYDNKPRHAPDCKLARLLREGE